MTTIHLEPHKVPAHLRGSYSGKRFQVQVCETVTIPADAGLWSGGSRDVFSAIELSTGRQVNWPGQNTAPWDNERRAAEVSLAPDFAVVRHTQGCYSDMTFYIHPLNAAALLPAPVELSDWDKIVLKATRNFKSSYGGKDRYQMALNEAGGFGIRNCAQDFPCRRDWELTKQALVDHGFLNKAGAITPSGRNAIA